MEIKDENFSAQFKVNGKRLKHYHGGDVTYQTSSFLLNAEWHRLSQAKDFKKVLYG